MKTTKTAAQILAAADVLAMPASLRDCLIGVAGGQPTAAVETGRTGYMDGDQVSAVQDYTVSVWCDVANAGKCYPDFFFVCGDAGVRGGLTSSTASGNAYVDTSESGHAHRIDVNSGDDIDDDFIL